MSSKVANLLVEVLKAAGVRRVYGVAGDSLNGVTDALRADGTIEWIHTRHEETAAFAAGAEAQLTGTLAVCAGSCGPGNTHLINGLFDAHRSRAPVLAIAAQIPSSEIGRGYFQETHPQNLFRECSHYCERVSNPAQLPEVFETAIRVAVGESGVSVIVLPGDVALAPAPEHAVVSPSLAPAKPYVRPRDAELDRLAAMLNEVSRITLLCGRGCRGAHAELMKLADTLKAPIVHAFGGKDAVEYDNPFDVGMTGLIGFSSGYEAMEDCDLLLMLGTGFPYRQFYPTRAKIAQVDLRAESLGRRCRVDLGLIGDVRDTIEALLPRLKAKSDRSRLEASLAHYRKAREGLGSLSHGSMANAMPQAIGAQVAFPGRQIVSLSGDGGFSMLMGDFLTLLQHKLPVKIVIFDNGTLGFVELEMKAAGFLDVDVALTNPDFAAMAKAAGVHAARVEDPADLKDAMSEAFAHDGPALLDVVTARQELAMPPRTEFSQAEGFSMWVLKAVLNGRADEVIDLARTNLRR